MKNLFVNRSFCLFVFLLILSSITSHAQSVRNVDFTCKGNEIHVTYDLVGLGSSDKDCVVNFYYSLDNGTTWQGPVNKNIRGAIGANVVEDGNALLIVWNPLAYLPWLFTENLTCKVELASFSEYTEIGLELKMVYVQGGTFTMGCTGEQSNCGEDEKPAHEVELDGYYIGKYEVTQAQWKAVMGNNPSYFSGWENCPVENVSWNDVQEFIKKLNRMTGRNYRLPTEAEWEFAARGGVLESSTIYSGSNTIDEVAEYTENNGSRPRSVGKRKPNELGLYDMSGNVWEWCGDWYSNSYYSNSPRQNPQGPETGTGRVLRGGGWDSFAGSCRVSYRDYINPDDRDYSSGFRLVLSRVQ